MCLSANTRSTVTDVCPTKMININNYFNELLAQRRAINLTLLSTQKNLNDNTQALVTCIDLLNDAPPSQPHLLTATTATQVMALLEASLTKDDEESIYQAADVMVILQLMALVNWPKNSSHYPDLVWRLYQHTDVRIQQLAPHFCLYLGQQFAVVEFPLDPRHEVALFNQHLLYLYYQRGLSDALVQQFRHLPGLAELSLLYLDVLTYKGRNFIQIVQQFTRLQYMGTHLFEIFITSLPELEASKLVNMLSATESHTPYVIEVMALSGYSKFIPYLARYMLSAENAAAAFTAIRLLLGQKLDYFMPLDVQFDSDEQAQIQHLQYYAAKLLDAWQNQAVDFSHTQMLDGQAVTMANIDNIIQGGSRLHRKLALLHRMRLKPNLFTPHFDMLEWRI